MTTGSNILHFSNTPSFASLPMYTMAELQDISAKWWLGVAQHMRRTGVTNVPDQLTDPKDITRHWLDPALLFSQTCGYPLTHSLANKVTVIAIPIYHAAGCHGAEYCSMIIVPENHDAENFDDLQGSTIAINARDSHSGFNVVRAMIAQCAKPGRSFFTDVTMTNAHIGSIEAVRQGSVHCAAIDAVTLALVEKYRPDILRGVRVLCQSPNAPGLPFITRKNISTAELKKLQDGLFAALADTELSRLADKMLIKGAVLAQPDDYQRILEIEKIGGGIDL